MSGVRLAVVGATGAVGREVLRILRERAFPLAELRLLASPRSAGRRLDGQTVEAVAPERFDGLDLAIFDTPDAVAEEWVPVAAARGVVAIDNSAAFRLADDVPLVIPEINPQALDHLPRRIVANPNCTCATIAVPLAALHREAGLRRVVACSYQSVSGAGQPGTEQLWRELREAVQAGRPPDRPGGTAFPHVIAMNVIPAIGRLQGAHTGEELKVAAELRKLLAIPDLAVGMTCVRVPTLVGHGVAVHAEFRAPLEAERARAILERAPGVAVVDEPSSAAYPTALLAAGRDPCFVGRIRTDGAGNLAFFAAADNLRKGAALNTVQIAEHLVQRGLIRASLRT
ncbi:MAG TPA: aspartate-semialdehyde dehydrogenase [bacterium]|nr:aspartate-semialdehyde dehydrogenase [bacterium]